jgi:hypothetical protein
VLGARAGRERYEQIRRAYHSAKEDPRLQSVAGMVQARADAAVDSAKSRLGQEPSSRVGSTGPRPGQPGEPGQPGSR